MSFARSVRLPVPPEEAFALVTEPERLRRWQTVSAYVDLRAGGEYRWTVTPGNVAAGTFRELEPGRRVVFGWGWEGSEELPPDASTVTVTIEPTEGGGSLVTLVHEGLSEEQVPGHRAGWDHYLTRLEKLATTGDAGVDDWAWAPERLDPVVAASAVLAALHPMLRRITARDAGRPTPCPDYTVEELAAHLVASLEHFRAMAGGGAATARVGGSFENRVSVAAGAAIDAWRSRGLAGTVTAPDGTELSAFFAASILPVELLLHGWDLSQAIGEPLHASEEVVTYVRRLAEEVVPASRAAGGFADPVEPDPGAGPLAQLAAAAGRSPRLP